MPRNRFPVAERAGPRHAAAMAVSAAQEAGINSACHIEGGIAAWKKAGGPVDH